MILLRLLDLNQSMLANENGLECKRYSFMTTNISESMSSMLKEAGEFLLCW